MPTYDYKCSECDYTFELFQHITEKPVEKCPVCGVLRVERMIGAGSGVIFRGSGFYQTDYRSNEYKSKAKKDSESVKSEAKTSEKK